MEEEFLTEFARSVIQIDAESVIMTRTILHVSVLVVPVDRQYIQISVAVEVGLSIHDVDYEKAAVIHYNRPYHAEYDLTSKPNDKLVAQTQFVPSQITENIQPIDNYTSAANPLTIAAMLMFIASGLLRRL